MLHSLSVLKTKRKINFHVILETRVHRLILLNCKSMLVNTDLMETYGFQQVAIKVDYEILPIKAVDPNSNSSEFGGYIGIISCENEHEGGRSKTVPTQENVKKKFMVLCFRINKAIIS